MQIKFVGIGGDVMFAYTKIKIDGKPTSVSNKRNMLMQEGVAHRDRMATAVNTILTDVQSARNVAHERKTGVS